jgi:hypothetical protein
MRLISTGGATLAAQKIKCDCGAERTLARIIEASPDGNATFLSSNLDGNGQLFQCQGKRPWLGTEDGTGCSRPLRGSLRSASNVYFADVRSAIYLPRGDDTVSSELVALFDKPPLSTLVRLLAGAGVTIEAESLRSLHFMLLLPYTNKQIASAVQIIISKKDEIISEEQQISLRKAEYDALREPRDENELLIKSTDITLYSQEISNYFARVMLVKKLRETRALAGFTRIFPQNGLTLEQRKSLLSREPMRGSNSWLPAYIVYGEGIFIEFNESKLNEWEERIYVKERVRPLVNRYMQVREISGIRERPLIPRFILLHTLAHLLINQLTFDCGYSSAALRERLYVSDDRNSPMAES